MHLLFLYIDQIYKIPFAYTKQPPHIPEAWKRYSFRAELSRLGHHIECTQERGGGGGVGVGDVVQKYSFFMLKIP